MASNYLWQVTAPHFCAGFVTRGEQVIRAAPILAWMIRDGRTRSFLRGYFHSKGWQVRCAGQFLSWGRIS